MKWICLVEWYFRTCCLWKGNQVVSKIFMDSDLIVVMTWSSAWVMLCSLELGTNTDEFNQLMRKPMKGWLLRRIMLPCSKDRGYNCLWDVTWVGIEYKKWIAVQWAVSSWLTKMDFVILRVCIAIWPWRNSYASLLHYIQLLIVFLRYFQTQNSISWVAAKSIEHLLCSFSPSSVHFMSVVLSFSDSFFYLFSFSLSVFATFSICNAYLLVNLKFQPHLSILTWTF